MLMVSLLILFCGLIFTIPIDKFPSEGFRKLIEVIALLLAITSTVFVIGMSMLFVVFNLLVANNIFTRHNTLTCNTVVWDTNTRKKNEGKRNKHKKKKLAAMIEERIEQGLPYDDLLKPKKTRYDQDGQVIFSTPFFDESSESDEDHPSTLNQILANLFSMRRLQRKLFLVNRKRQRIQSTLQQTATRYSKTLRKIRHKSTVAIEEPPQP